MNLTAEEKYIRILAIKCWNHGKLPPENKKAAVLVYIINHPDMFQRRNNINQEPV